MVIKQAAINDVGAILRFGCTGDTEVPYDILKMRLDAEGLGEYAPTKRVYSDALRCAFTNIEARSKRIDVSDDGDGKTGTQTCIIFKQVPRVKGEPFQKWAVHEQVAKGAVVTKSYLNDDGDVVTYDEVSGKGGSVEYHELGYVYLYDTETSGESSTTTISVPPALSSWDVQTLAHHYTTHADASKIRTCLRDIVFGVASPMSLAKGMYFVSLDKHDILTQKVEPVFASMAKGEVSLIMYTVSGSAANTKSLKKDLAASVGSEMNKIVSAIMKAKTTNANVTKSMVLGWIDAIDNIKANMSTFGLLDMEMPAELEDLEIQVAALKAEADKPGKKKRMIQITKPDEVSDDTQN